ncbi:MAG: hypothetical protein AAF438_20050 [Pseudomonadota bacterium]
MLGKDFSLVAQFRTSRGHRPSAFAAKWAVVVGYQVRVRCVSAGPGRFAVSVPVVVPEGQVVLRGGQRGGRVRVRVVR